MRVVSVRSALLGILIGLLLGAMLFRPVAVRASGMVFVQRISVLGNSGSGVALGSRVVGFSCVQGGDGAPACFVASE